MTLASLLLAPLAAVCFWLAYSVYRRGSYTVPGMGQTFSRQRDPLNFWTCILTYVAIGLIVMAAAIK